MVITEQLAHLIAETTYEQLPVSAVRKPPSWAHLFTHRPPSRPWRMARSGMPWTLTT